MLVQWTRVGFWILSVSIAALLFNGSLFSYHPAFMSLGYIAFMAEGLVSAVQFRQLDGERRVKAIQRHAVWQIAAILCIAIGWFTIYTNKVLRGKRHFVSRHAKIGLATLLLTIAAPLLGTISFKWLGLLQKFPEEWQPRLKTWHRKMGAATWFTALATIELGLLSHSVNKGVVTVMWMAGVLVVGGLLAAILAQTPTKIAAAEVHEPDVEQAKAN